jgi:hypothetical protein
MFLIRPGTSAQGGGEIVIVMDYGDDTRLHFAAPLRCQFAAVSGNPGADVADCRSRICSQQQGPCIPIGRIRCGG